MDTITSLLSGANAVPVLAIVIGCSVGVIAIITCACQAVSVNKEREKTKREIAAYVAEGTIDPQTAVTMMNAGKPANIGVAICSGKEDIPTVVIPS